MLGRVIRGFDKLTALLRGKVGRFGGVHRCNIMRSLCGKLVQIESDCGFLNIAGNPEFDRSCTVDLVVPRYPSIGQY